MSSNQTSEPAVTPKKTLYCFDCGHESPIGGDWTVRATDDGVDYDCPECRTTIISRRPRVESDTSTTTDVCPSAGD